MRRVVITGVGVRSPLGHTGDTLFDAILDNRSGIRAMPEWKSIDHLNCHVAGSCEDIDEKAIPRNHRRTMGRVAVLAGLSAMDAVRDAGLSDEEVSSPGCGVSYGSTEGSSSVLEEFLSKILSDYSLKGLASSTYLKFMSHTCAANIAGMFQSRGPVIASCTACVAGSQGIGFGYEAIREGRADVMITGGAEELHFVHAGVFDVMRATSTGYNGQPEETPRPFDRDRDGLVVSEGSGCLILEEYERARSRGAKIYGEVRGYGTNCDGFHLTRPSSEGMSGVMKKALADASLNPEDIGHINAHATATEAGDVAESEAVHSLFGDRVPVTAFKGYLGHSLGACGAIESIISLWILARGVIPSSRNLSTPDPECAPVAHVREIIEEKPLLVMNNNFAFGGINTSLIFSTL